MHSCSTICKLAAPTATRSSVKFYDQRLNVVETVDSADFTSIQRYGDNTEGLVRVDSNSPVVCTDESAQMIPCMDMAAQAQVLPFVNEHAQIGMLPCIDNLRAKGQRRLSIDAEEEDEMQPCMYTHPHQTAACIDVYAEHAQAASFREQRVHDIRMQTDDGYSYAQEVEGYVRMESCLPAMSSRLMECIERARARAVRCAGMWTMMQVMSTVSQIMGVVVVLGLYCSKEEVVMRRSLHYTMSSPLPAWALGYALGCLALLPLFCIKHSRSIGSDDLPNIAEQSAHDNRVEGVERRLRRCVDFFFGIWFVLGMVWVFGRPSCAQASPKLYSLCVTLLMLNGLRYMMPLILCCALCCCLQPTTSRISNDFDGKKGATQENIDATLPIFKFKHRRPITNNPHHETFSITHTTIADKSICMDGMEYCCICLKRYKEDAKLRGLPCSHYFHVECVDKWLKINASCPLCKFTLKANELHPFSFF